MPVDDSATKAALKMLAVKVKTAATQIVTEGVGIMKAEGMQRTPVKSGTLRRSWHSELRGENFAQIGPTMIYARRIELGFVGPDKLGRVYNQQGKPYVRPAYEAALPRIQKRAKTIIENKIGV